MRYPALLLTAAAVLGVAACRDDDMQRANAPQVATPPVGASDSPTSNSSSNAASGSTIRSQQAPGSTMR
jgi:hypothetical protein